MSMVIRVHCPGVKEKVARSIETPKPSLLHLTPLLLQSPLGVGMYAYAKSSQG